MNLPKLSPGPYRLTGGLYNDIIHNESQGKGSTIASVYRRNDGRDNPHAFAALPQLLSALNLAWEFLEDLRTSNPGYLRNLTLRNYENLNRLGEIPAALKAAGCTEQQTL